MYTTTATLVAALLAASGAQAHITAWSKGMYCKNGLSHSDDPNAAYPADPLVSLHFKDWFMHGPCINYPPPAGEFLDLPAGGSFTVEMAGNRAFTTLSYNGSKTSDWGDGNAHPTGYGDARVDTHFPLTSLGCISSPNLHCKDASDAAGSAFAIAYKSDIHSVTMDDLVVFTVAPNTPYKRVATFQVPKQMPACPPEGCICAWGWVPNHCGEANEYMNGYRCRVTNVQPDARALGKPQNPTWCEGTPDKCTKGPKKMSIGFQLDGNTVKVVRDVPQADGQWRSWGYNMKLGFQPGAQNDIFVNSTVPAPKPAVTTASAPKPTSTPKPPPVATSKPAPKPTSTSKPAPKPTSTSKPAPKPTAHTVPPSKPAPTSTSKPAPKPKPTATKPKPTSTSKPAPKPTAHTVAPKPKPSVHTTAPKPHPTKTNKPKPKPHPKPAPHHSSHPPVHHPAPKHPQAHPVPHPAPHPVAHGIQPHVPARHSKRAHRRASVH